MKNISDIKIRPLEPELKSDYLDFLIVVRLQTKIPTDRVTVRRLIRKKKLLNKWLVSFLQMT